MPDEDDDDVAIDDGAEPDGGADDGDDAASANEPRVAAGGPITTIQSVRSGTRPISDKVREVFAASMAKSKKKETEDEGTLEPVEHEDLPTEAAPVVKVEGGDTTALDAAPPAEQPKAPVAAVPAVSQPPPQPPAPSLDPEVMRMRGELEQQRKDFEAERAKFMEERHTGDLAKLRDTYFDKGAPAVVEIVKQWMPGLEGDELKKEVADLIQDLAHQFLDAPIDEAVRDRMTNKRVRQGLKTWKAEQERAEQQRLEQLKASQEAENKLRVKGILHQEVTKPENAAKYPYLALESNAGEIVFEAIDQNLKKTGVQWTWTEAAQAADSWLKEQSSAFFDKRKHLLSPTAPPPSEKQRAQGDTQVSRSHAPPKKPAPKPQDAQRQPLPEARLVNKKWTPESHRAATMSKFRGQIHALNDEE